MDTINGGAGGQRSSEQNLERTALAGAAAIQSLINERDELRGLTHAQQVQISRLARESGDARRRLAEIRRDYLELATVILERFEKFDTALRHATEGPCSATALTEDDTIGEGRFTATRFER
jgi:hypothetical protein